MAETLATEVWLLTRIGKNDRIEVLGAFDSKESAEENITVLPGQHWQITGPTLLLGWGFIAETGRKLSNTPISWPSRELH